MQMEFKEGARLQVKQVNLAAWPYTSDFRVIDIGLQSLPQRLRRANKARHVAGISLYGDPGRQFAVKMKSGIYWTTKDVGDAKAVEYM